LGEVADYTDVDRDVVFLGSTCKGERVPLKVRNLGAGKEDVLTSSGGCLLLFDLKLHDIGWMLDDLRHICPVTGAYFAEDTLRNPNDASNEPIAPEDSDGVGRAIRRAVGFDHAEHAMQLPIDEEHNEQVVRIPKPLKVSTTSLLTGEKHYDS